MYNVLIAIHIIITLSLIVIILMQRTSSDGMGLSGSSSSNSFMSGRAAATFVTRSTGVLAALFILSSLGLGIVTAHNREASGSIMDKMVVPAKTAPAVPRPETPAGQAAPVAPATPVTPAVPRPE
jgi:preprotein translocase subunit SecG